MYRQAIFFVTEIVQTALPLVPKVPFLFSIYFPLSNFKLQKILDNINLNTLLLMVLPLVRQDDEVEI